MFVVRHGRRWVLAPVLNKRPLGVTPPIPPGYCVNYPKRTRSNSDDNGTMGTFSITASGTDPRPSLTVTTPSPAQVPRRRVVSRYTFLLPCLELSSLCPCPSSHSSLYKYPSLPSHDLERADRPSLLSTFLSLSKIHYFLHHRKPPVSSPSSYTKSSLLSTWLPTTTHHRPEASPTASTEWLSNPPDHLLSQ